MHCFLKRGARYKILERETVIVERNAIDIEQSAFSADEVDILRDCVKQVSDVDFVSILQCARGGRASMGDRYVRLGRENP